jgi:hypothetical protein
MYARSPWLSPLTSNQVGDHQFLIAQLPQPFASIAALDDLLLPLDEGSPSRCGHLILIQHVIYPTEIGIGPVSVSHERPIRQQANGVIGLFACLPGN